MRNVLVDGNFSRLELTLLNDLERHGTFEGETVEELEGWLLDRIRNLSYDNLLGLVVLLEKYNFFRVEHHNGSRRSNRRREYAAVIGPAVLDLAVEAGLRNVLDVGTGDGAIFSSLIDILAEGGCAVTPFSGDLVDYCKPELKAKVGYQYLDVKNLPFDDNSFDLAAEITMLHHLPSKEDYREGLAEMVRVTRRGRYLLVVETVHATRDEHYLNAVLDIYLNCLTSIQEGTGRIPVPVNFLSERELEAEFIKHDLRCERKFALDQTVNDPKRHNVYVLQKEG